MSQPNPDFYLEAKKIWRTVVNTNAEYSNALEQQIEHYRKLLNIFQVGKSYIMVFNIFQVQFEVVSESIKNVLGYEAHEMNIELYLDSIHPDDKSYVLSFERRITEFFKALPFEKIPKYKVQYDIRVKAKSGHYIRILQQGVQIDFDETN